MKKRIFEFSILILAILNSIAMFIVLLTLPDTVPIHTNFESVIDNMGSKWFSLLFIIIPVGVCALAFVDMRGKYKNSTNNKIKNIVVACIICLLIYIGWIVIALQSSGLTLGEKFNYPLGLLILLPLGLFMVIISIFMPQIKQNRILGIRLYSTLTNDIVWEKTHYIAGITGKIGGIVLIAAAIISCFIDSYIIIIVSLILSIILLAIIPIIYSACIYKKHGGNLNKQQEQTKEE